MRLMWHNGNTYRVSPAWSGPAKPEPVVEYEDVPIDRNFDKYHYMFARDGEAIRSIVSAPGDPRFAGYVYATDDRKWCSPALICDKQDDGTYRLRVPKAVRFVKQ
jgi:hypothetical protein